MSDFGETLQKIRTEKKVTQEQLAKAIGKSPQYISNLETGLRKDPRLSMLQALAAALGVKLDAFAGAVVPPKKTPGKPTKRGNRP